MSQPTSQQEFLRDAMSRLKMTREQFADRLGTSKRRLDNWLTPSDSNEFREMDSMVWKFVREIPSDGNLKLVEHAPLSRYKHYKDGEYEVVCNAILEADPSVMMVIYRSADGRTWARPIDNFNENVEINGVKVPRFTLLA